MTATETGVTIRSELSVAEVIGQTTKIQEVLKGVMKRDEHYGVIPGTGSKPVLLKAGAEKLCLMFRMAPDYDIVSKTEDPAGHASFTIRCSLTHIPTGNKLGSGMGSATTREPKWGMVEERAKCPRCGKAAIIKGKAEYGGGWLCFKKKEGCGAKFEDGNKTIEGQKTAKTWRENLPEMHNTVLKMACKRALVAAVLNATAASDCFTQDIEDLHQAADQYRDEPEVVKQAEVVKPAKAAESAKAPTGAMLISDPQRKRLFSMLKTYGKTEEQFRAYLLEAHGLKSSKDILAKDYHLIEDWIIPNHGLPAADPDPGAPPLEREPGDDDAIGDIPL